MNTSQREAQTQVRRTLLAILAVFVLPLALAWLFILGPVNWRPEKTVNFGVLLQPPLQLETYGVMDATGAALQLNAVARDWYLVVMRDAACTELCQFLSQFAERIQIALGRDMNRVTLASLGPDGDTPLARGQRWLLPADDKIFEVLRRTTGEPQLATVMLIVDYQGRVVLVYPVIEDGQGVLDDLKRLLRATAR